MAHTFTYTTLTPAHAEAWRALRLEGARDFPLGFLVSAREAEALTGERCAEILKFGALRGVLDAGRLNGFQHIATLEDNVRLDGASRTDLWMVLRLDAPNVSRK